MFYLQILTLLSAFSVFFVSVSVISPNRELVALGAGSVVGSMFGSFTAFGSIPRTKSQ
jgi:MFS superfamily sulfate permease-like transporter